jgi:hypothetical protein
MKLLDTGPTALGHEFIELSADVTVALLNVLVDGWKNARAWEDITVHSGEVPITERLRDGMRQVLKGHQWGKTLWVLPGTESRSAGALVPDGRTDIPIAVVEIFLRHGEHDPHAIVECKRIAGSDTHLCREYVVEGRDRFRTGKYGFNHAVGFMVGYVISGTEREAAAGINGYLKRQKRADEGLRSPGAVASTWTSHHARVAPSPAILLHHAFLEFAATRKSQRRQ